MRHSGYVILFCIALLLCLLSSDVFANIFAAHVELDFNGTFPATIRYRLNEDATSVAVYIKKDNVLVRTLAGAGDQLTSKHDATISWDGRLQDGSVAPEGIYTVEIEAASDGHTTWTIISDQFATERRLPEVRGVAANKNNGSINFGRVYVLEQHTRSAGIGQFRPRGVWLYRNDLSFWGDSQDSAYASGNYYSSLSEYCDVSLWCSWFETETLRSISDYEDSNGPFRIAVDKSDYVYVSTSLADALGGVTVGDADFSKESIFFLLNRLPYPVYNAEPSTLSFCTFVENIWMTDSLYSYQTYGITRNHGLCSGMWIDGVGKSRVLYVCDNYDWNGYMDETWGHQWVVKFAVGDYVEQGMTFPENPEVILPNELAPEATKIQFDANGNLFVGGGYNRWPGFTQFHSLQKFHRDGDTYVLDWERVVPNSVQTMSMAYDPRTNRLAVSDLEAPGYIRFFDTETGALQEEVFSWENALRNFDIDFDAAGNIIGANRAIGQVICLSPPDGPNSFITESGYAFKVGADAGVIISNVEHLGRKTVPAEFNLVQNYPNPFSAKGESVSGGNPSTVIEYDLVKVADVTLAVFDVTGREVIVLVKGRKPAGHHTVTWDGRDDSGNLLPTGVYVYRLRVGHFVESKKMVLVR